MFSCVTAHACIFGLLHADSGNVEEKLESCCSVSPNTTQVNSKTAHYLTHAYF